MNDHKKASAGSTQRIDSLQAVRAIAFSGIFVYHAIRTFPGSGRIYRYIATGPGPWGVSVFFVLSGFLMTYSYWNREPGITLREMALFALKKIRKLYPLHLIMIFAGVVYSLKQGADFRYMEKYLVRTILLLQTWFPAGYQAINTVAWYLSVSLFLYFIFPFLLPAVKRGTVKGSAGKIAVVYLLQFAIGYYVSHCTAFDVKWITYCHPLYRTGDFIIGALTASVYVKAGKRKHLSKRACSALEWAAVFSNLAVCMSYFRVAERAQWFAYTCLFIPTSILLVYSFALDNGMLSGRLKNGIIFWLAEISPYGFLIHRLVIYYFYDFAAEVLHRKSLNYLIETAVPFIITVAGCYLYLAAVKSAGRRSSHAM